MENFELIAQGAEARLYKGIYLERMSLVKERFVKNYRHPELDICLTKDRMKAEARAIVRAKSAGTINRDENISRKCIRLNTRSDLSVCPPFFFFPRDTDTGLVLGGLGAAPHLYGVHRKRYNVEDLHRRKHLEKAECESFTGYHRMRIGYTYS